MKYIYIILFLFACNKQQPQQPVRTGGAMPDLPNTVQIVASKGFHVKKPIADIVESKVLVNKGKPVKLPTVSFLSPVNGAVVSGVVTISVSIRNAASVSIAINGTVVSSSTSYQWNTNGLFSGNYLLSAMVKDSLGNSRTTSIVVSINTIVVEPPAPVPYTRITMPPPIDQGSEGSCVAMAVGYAARSVEYFNKTNDLKTFSPEHLYNHIKFSPDCYSGTAMQTALEFIIANGILPWSEMPYTSGNCSPYETEAQKQIALTYKIDGFFKMYCTDTAMIKGMIRLNKPVIINVLADQSFMNAGTNFIWSVYSGSGMLPHCIVICGYDDSKKAYRVFNSWGNSWGDNGEAWIDYDFFLTKTGTYCYAIN
jgi:hypothetical protein